MTFNATNLHLALCGSAGLVARDSQYETGAKVRHLLVTEEISALLDGKLPHTGFPNIDPDVVVSKYLFGHRLNVSRRKMKRKKKGPYIHLEQIEGVDEVWALCCRKPPPGWRLMGRFMQRDMLVLLRFYHKDEIGIHYPERSQEVIEDWSKRFPQTQPCTGGSLSAYLSGEHYDVDQETERS